MKKIRILASKNHSWNQSVDEKRVGVASGVSGYNCNGFAVAGGRDEDVEADKAVGAVVHCPASRHFLLLLPINQNLNHFLLSFFPSFLRFQSNSNQLQLQSTREKERKSEAEQVKPEAAILFLFFFFLSFSSNLSVCLSFNRVATPALLDQSLFSPTATVRVRLSVRAGLPAGRPGGRLLDCDAMWWVMVMAREGGKGTRRSTRTGTGWTDWPLSLSETSKAQLSFSPWKKKERLRLTLDWLRWQHRFRLSDGRLQ
jgi:hypothetical protein